MALKNYLDFAENDYQYLIASYEAGIVANMMGAMAQGICEKYMKHIISQFTTPSSGTEQLEKEALLKTHNLQRLIRYMESKTDFQFTKETKSLMLQINGYYFSTRYPGDDSIELDKEDIEDCILAAKGCREEVLEMTKS